ASADRQSAQLAAHSIGVSRPTVWRWQQSFAESGVEGLLRDRTRKPGKTPIATEATARGVARARTEPPPQATHRTGRAMAKATGISLGSIQRGDPTGEADKVTSRLDFDLRLLLQFRGSAITSNAGCWLTASRMTRWA